MHLAWLSPSVSQPLAFIFCCLCHVLSYSFLCLTSVKLEDKWNDNNWLRLVPVSTSSHFSSLFCFHVSLSAQRNKKQGRSRSKVTGSLVPKPPFNSLRGKGDLVNTVQHFCTSEEFWQQNLTGWCGNYLTYTGLPYHKVLSFTHHTFTDLLSPPPICWSPASNLTGLAFSRIHSNC